MIEIPKSIDLIHNGNIVLLNNFKYSIMNEKKCYSNLLIKRIEKITL